MVNKTFLQFVLKEMQHNGIYIKIHLKKKHASGWNHTQL